MSIYFLYCVCLEMSIDITITNQKNSSTGVATAVNNNNSSSSNSATSLDASSADASLNSPSSYLYQTKTLLCKNKCGYYGNSIQYQGYCSICFRKLKPSKQQQQQNSNSNSYLTSSVSFDDSASLLSSSFSYNFEENKM